MLAHLWLHLAQSTAVFLYPELLAWLASFSCWIWTCLSSVANLLLAIYELIIYVTITEMDMRLFSRNSLEKLILLASSLNFNPLYFRAAASLKKKNREEVHGTDIWNMPTSEEAELLCLKDTRETVTVMKLYAINKYWGDIGAGHGVDGGSCHRVSA